MPNLTLKEAYRVLSRRECQILDNLQDDKTVSEISNEHFLSQYTVKNHIANIGKRLGIKGKGELRKWLKSLSNLED